MKRILLTVCMGLMAAMCLVSCDVHEFPEEGGGQGERETFVLSLDYTDALKWGFHKEIDYSGNETRVPAAEVPEPQSVDVRYVVQAYRVQPDGTTAQLPDTVVTETKSDTAHLNHSMALRLEKGAYKFLVWTDYVAHGSTADLYYKTGNFKEITYSDPEDYTGNTDLRQAFRGERDAVVKGPDTVKVTMERPMAKFKFISTDLQEFLAMVVLRRAGKGAAPSKSELDLAVSKINVADFKIRFRYAGFMPCAFNVWTNRPVDSWTGIDFFSRMRAITVNETELGYDLVLVNGHESSVAVCLEVYDRDGTLLSSTDPINVPLVRNKLTVVRGHFLTSKASGGIGIVTKFDGEYDYEV